MTYKFDQIVKGGVAVLIAVLLSACQTYQSKDRQGEQAESAGDDSRTQYTEEAGDKHHGRIATFKRDKKLGLVPVNKAGKEYKSCGTLNHNHCALFHNKIKLDKLEPIIFVDYQINPHCQVIIVGNRVYYDHDNPHCPDEPPM